MRQIAGVTAPIMIGDPQVPQELPPQDSSLEPINWFKAELRLPGGELVPYLKQVDDTLMLSTKIRTCAGSDSWCSDQCKLTVDAQEHFRSKPCPMEAQRAFSLLTSFCKDLQLLMTKGDSQPDLAAIMEELIQMDLINEYILWDLFGFRAAMQQAGEELIERVPTSVKGSDVFMTPLVNPLVDISEKVTNIKIRLQREFMTTRKERFQASLKVAEREDVLASYLEKVRNAAQSSQYVIEVESDESR